MGPLVANMLEIPRGLVTLDEYIDPNHSITAPRDNVILECKYSAMKNALPLDTALQLEKYVTDYICKKNAKRKEMGKSLLKTYYKDYALLQEVTKAALIHVCGDI